MKFFPDDPKKLKSRIKSYEKKLKDPEHRDGAGKRLLAGTMYLLLDDTKGAINYYNWYQENFPDDSAEPLNHTSWTLALLRSGKPTEARSKLFEAFLSNVHIIDWLLGKELKPHDLWYGTNWAEPDYLLRAPEDFLSLWTKDEISWVKEFSENPKTFEKTEKVISLKKKLHALPVGPERFSLIEEISSIKYD